MWPKRSIWSTTFITCPPEKSSFKARPTRCAQGSSRRFASSSTANPMGRSRSITRRRIIGTICSRNDRTHRGAPARARRAHREQLGLASRVRVPIPVVHAQGVRSELSALPPHHSRNLFHRCAFGQYHSRVGAVRRNG